MGQVPVPSLAVVIVSWNVCRLLDRCLITLQDDLARATVQADVWVVDNASTDGSADMVRERHPWIHLEASEVNLGFVRGNNAVLRTLLQHGIPDYVWLLNPDTEVQSGAVETLLRFAATHPRAGLLGPQLRNSDGSLQPGAFRFPGIGQPLFDLGLAPQRLYYTRFNGRYPLAAYTGATPFPIDHPLGAAMLARGAAVQAVGLLDEQFFMYCEEVDWAWRMRKAGWDVWMVPAARVIHHGGASSEQVRPATQTYLWESRARLYRKHHGALTRAVVRAAVQRVFTARRRTAPSPEWAAAYERILQAWKE